MGLEATATGAVPEMGTDTWYGEEGASVQPSGPSSEQGGAGGVGEAHDDAGASAAQDGTRPRRRVGRPRVARDRAEARRKILDAAETLFADNGFDATPTSAVAERAGVTGALIFYYFETKRGLLEALIDERPFLPRFAELVADAQDLDRRALLQTAGIRLFQLAHRNGPMVRIVVREVLQKRDLRAHWEDVLERAVQALAQRIAAADGPPMSLATAGGAARVFFNAIAFQALFGPDVEAERAVEETIDLVLAAC